MLLMITIALASLIAIIAAVDNRRRLREKFKQEVTNYKIETCQDTDRVRIIQSHISKHEELKQRICAVKANAMKLEIPTPPEPNFGNEGHELIRSITLLASHKDFALAGTEQLLLSLLPPDQLFESLHFAAKELGAHTSQAITENLSTIKSAFAQGASNIHNPGLILDCINHFSTGCLEYLQNPIHVKELAFALDHENIGKIISSFVNFHSVSSGISPIIDINAHGAEIGHSWMNNAHDAIYSIGSNIEEGLHPDPTAHFPYITLAFSTIREINLLNEEKTTFESSIKNVGLDVAGTGIGALGGAKAGAAGGALIAGPVGAVVGGFLGAIGGAMFGRGVTNEVKRGPLNNAISEYRSSFEEMKSETKRAAVHAINYVRSVSIEERGVFSNLACSPPILSEAPISALKIDFQTAQQSDIASIEEKITAFKKSPYALDMYCREQIERIGSELNIAKDEINKEHTSAITTKSSHVVHLSPKYIKGGKYDCELTNVANKLYNANTKSSFVLMAWLTNIANQHRLSLSKIAAAMNEKMKEYSNESEEWRLVINSKMTRIDVEKRKLGL